MESYTVDELHEKFGTECNLCDNFDLDECVCKKGKHPREYVLEDGPNEFCYALKNCKLFSQWAPSEEDVKKNVSSRNTWVVQEANR